MSKIKSYDGNVNTNFHSDKIPKEGSWCMSIGNTDWFCS